ncbi:MAG: hypothetical protein OCD01_04600 [Fibrobacterales bacterium]
MKKQFTYLSSLLVLPLMIGCTEMVSQNDSETGTESAATPTAVQVIDLENETLIEMNPTIAAKRRRSFEIVHLKGEVRHFGYDITQQPPAYLDYTAIVANAKVWIAEYPFTKYLNITTDENGQWELYILKRINRDIAFSFSYEKDFYPAEVEGMVFPGGLPERWSIAQGQSNIFTIGSEDILDIGMQLPDELYMYFAKSQLEGQIAELIGQEYPISNIMVSTVGKSWSSLFDMRLPHGDPGALVSMVPAQVSPLQGPIYFNEAVLPDPTYTSTSVDGGVLFNNLTPGMYDFTAHKEGVTYGNVSFNINATQTFYVASPPHSLEGSNNSGPGED